MKNKKWMILFGLAIAGALVLGASPAQASQIPFGGTVSLNQLAGQPGYNSLAVSFNFTGLTVNSVPGGDTLNGASVSINPSGSGFVMSGPITTNSNSSTATFSAANGTFSLGNAATGTIAGNVNFISIAQDNTRPGYFGVDIGLTDLTITGGSSALVNSLVGSTGGLGSLSFNFSDGPQTLTALEGIGTQGSQFGGSLTDSVAGTIAVPEPATLALFGGGLLGLAFFKRRLFESGGLDVQS